jgi:formylmethanofuran dehydrogenase subunit B
VANFGPVTCAGCGLLCDDVAVEDSGEAVRLRPDCALGAVWFSERLRRRPDAPAATLAGQPADVEPALRRAAELLRTARRPLVHGFHGATVEDARAALSLADRLGALVNIGEWDGDGAGAWPGAPASPLRGVSTATLGEIRDRSRLVVIWREDPDTTHPRLLERLGFASPSAGRVLVVVDDRDTATAARADVRLSWPPERDLAALVTLHGLVKTRPPLTAPAGDLTGLYERLSGVPHAAFVYGPGLVAGAGGQRRALALYELVRALCQERHAVTLELPQAPGTRGADDVLAWQSGYGGKVDFATGHPELVIDTQLLADVDVTLLVESGPAGGLVAGPGAEVWIRTAAAGVEATGTVHRLDGVPLTLQAPLENGAPSAAALLTRLLEEVQR